MYTTDRARLESALARAHRALFDASTAAEALNEFGTEEDLRQIMQEVTRLSEASLKGSPGRRQIAGQLRLS